MDPPVTFENPKAPNPKNSPSQKPSAKYSEFQYHQELVTREGLVLSEGIVDKEGRERVFRYISGQTEMVKVGYIESVQTQILSASKVKTEYVIQWVGQEKISNLGVQKPGASLQVPFSGDLSSQHRAGEFFSFEKTHSDHSVTKRAVYYEGRQHKGKERVFQINPKNPLYVLRGLVKKDYKSRNGYQIEWEKDFTPRHRLTDKIQDKLVGQKPAATEKTSVLKNEKTLLLTHDKKAPPNATGSGHAEKSSPYKDFIKDDHFRPSQLKKTMAWSQNNYEIMKAKIQDLKNGEFRQAKELSRDLKKFHQQAKTKTLNSVKQESLSIGAGVLAFYVALGVMAAVKINMDYGSDPHAWDSFTDSLSDPFGYMIFAGFLMGASSIYLARRVGGLKSAPGAPTFILGLLAGAVASTAMAQFLYHEKFTQCIGLQNFKEKGVSKPNLQACDVMWDSFSKERLADEVLPTLASLSLAGGLFYGAAIGAGKLAQMLMQRQAIAQILNRASFYILRAPPAGPIVTGGKYLLGALFIISAHEMINDSLGLGKWISDNQITHFSFQKNHYGQTMSENYQKLTSAWALVSSHFQNIQSSYEQCQNQYVTTGSPTLPCQEVGPIAFDQLIGDLQRFGQIQKRWRINQFQPTLSAYESYVKKMNTFYTQADVAHRFYYQVIHDLQKERQTNKINITEPSEPYLDALNQKLKSQFEKANWTHTNEFVFVQTESPADFLLTSMICGSQVEAQADQNSILSPLTNWFKDYNSPGPRLLIENGKYSELKFNPPRLPVIDNKDHPSFCGRPGGHTKQTPSRQFKSHSLKGMTRILKTVLDPRFTQGPDMSEFQNWWRDHVTSQIRTTEKDFRDLYREMLREKYHPALHSKEIFDSLPTSEDKSLKPYREALKALAEEKRGIEIHDFNIEYGLIASMKEELRVYLALFIHLEDLASSLAENRKSQKLNPKVIQKAKEILDWHDQLYQSLTQKSSFRNSDAKKAGLHFNSLENEFLQEVDAPLYQLDDRGELPFYLLEFRNQLIQQLEEVVREIQVHTDVVRNLKNL